MGIAHLPCYSLFIGRPGLVEEALSCVLELVLQEYTAILRFWVRLRLP